MAAFAAAVLVGYLANNAAFTIIYRALLTMLVCWVLGYLVGCVAQQVIDQRIENYKREHPLAGEGAEAAGDGRASTGAATAGDVGGGATSGT